MFRQYFREKRKYVSICQFGINIEDLNMLRVERG